MTGWAFQVAARTLCQEVRGEPLAGQQAVAYVIKNRVADGRWGKNLASVCLWRAQFPGWYSPRGNPPVQDPNFFYACALADSDPTLSHMCSVLQAALDSSTDPTNGAMWYANLSLVNPPWIVGATHCGKFGNQDFYKDVK